MTSFLSVLFISSSFSYWIKILGGAVCSEHWLLSNGQRSHVWFTFSTTFSNVIPKAEKGMNLELMKKKTVQRFDRADQSCWWKPSHRIQLLILHLTSLFFSAFGYFFPFSISLKYEADNPVSTPSCLRPNPFYYQKQRSFIPKILSKLNYLS